MILYPWIVSSLSCGSRYVITSSIVFFYYLYLYVCTIIDIWDIPIFFIGPRRDGQANGPPDVSNTLPDYQNERNGWIPSFEWWPTMCQCLLLVRAQETSRTGPHGGGEDWIGKGKIGQVLFATKALHHHYSLILLKGECILICYKSLLLTSLAEPVAFTQDACTYRPESFCSKKFNFGDFGFSCLK